MENNNISKYISDTLKQAPDFQGQILLDEPLAPKSTFKVGGKTDLFLAPENLESLTCAINLLNTQKAKFFILGGGSNVVFPEHFQGTILSTQSFSKVQIVSSDSFADNPLAKNLNKDEVLVSCLSGTPMATFVNFCTKNNLSGAEQFAGLPGSIGGAVYMNARCFDKSISDILFQTQVLNFQNDTAELKSVPFDASLWDYKKSPFQDNKSLIVQAVFRLTKKSPEEHDQIEKNCKFYISERVDKGHFKFPSAGSVFKNNRSFGKPSGQIIDQTGLKGYAIGGAQVAPFHGNFIINTGNATSTDIEQLVLYIQEKVHQKFNFLLEPEIILLH